MLLRYQYLEENLKNCGTPFAIKLLRTADRLIGKRQKKTKESINVKIDINKLKEKVFLKIIEDCDDRNTVSNETLVQAVYLFEDYNYDADQARSVKEVYDEIMKRAHLLSHDQIESMQKSFDRLQNLRLLKFLPDIKKDLKKKLEKVNPDDLIEDYLGAYQNKQYIVNYNSQYQRVSVNNSEGFRFSIQSISNYGLRDMHKVIQAFDKEQPDAVFLSLPIDKSRILHNQDDIDNELQQYTQESKRFKIGETERVVYERVTGMKQANIALSILFSLSSEGNGLYNVPVGLMVPPLEQCTELVFQELIRVNKKPSDIFRVMKDHIFLDQQEWLSLVNQYEGCPQCRYDQIDYGPDSHYPYIRHLTNREINKSFLINHMILNLKESAQLLKKEGKPLRVLVFLDDKYCDVLNFARRLIKFQPPVYTTPEEKMTTNEFHQLSFLFEGMTRSEKIMGNRELHSTIWNELHETNSIDAMEPHKKQIIFHGRDKKYKSDYKDQVIEQYPNFDPFGRKTIQLDDMHSMHYMHEGTWVIVQISRKPDVTLYEAFNFLERFKEAICNDSTLSDVTQICAPDAPQKFKKLGKQVSEFIRKWNENPKNRDQTYLIFQELLQTKEEMVKNIHLITERDLLLDVCVEKTQGLDKQARILRKNAKKSKKVFKRRRVILWVYSDTNKKDSQSIISKFCCCFTSWGSTQNLEEDVRVWTQDFQDSDAELLKAKEKIFMRILFKPDSQILWGLNTAYMDQLLLDKWGTQDEQDDFENDVDMAKSMWLVLRKTRPQNQTLKQFFSENYTFKVKIKDIIKFGRVNFKITSLSSKKLDIEVQNIGQLNSPVIQPNQNLVTANNNYDRNLISHTSMNQTDMNLLDGTAVNQTQINMPQKTKELSIKKAQKSLKKQNSDVQSEQKVCRICLGEEEDDDNNEFISPCKCAGSMKYIHKECLREWLNGKKLVYNGDRVKSFFWKALECELCKTAFEHKMKSKLFEIMDFERPSSEFMIMESVKSAPAKVVHVFYLNKSNEFKVGRSVDTDMKIADISVSRVHSYIKIKNGQLWIEDNGSKFGTLVKIKEPYDMLESGNQDKQACVFQIGRSLLYFQLQQKNQGKRKMNKQVRKIESLNKLEVVSGYQRIKSGRVVPVQFVSKKNHENFEDNQISQMIFQMGRPQTGRMNEDEEESQRVGEESNSSFQEVSSPSSQHVSNQASINNHDEEIPAAASGAMHSESRINDFESLRNIQAINNIERQSRGQYHHNSAIQENESISSAHPNQMHYSQIKRQISPRHINQFNDSSREDSQSRSIVPQNKKPQQQFRSLLVSHSKNSSNMPVDWNKINRRVSHTRYKSVAHPHFVGNVNDITSNQDQFNDFDDGNEEESKNDRRENFQPEDVIASAKELNKPQISKSLERSNVFNNSNENSMLQVFQKKNQFNLPQQQYNYDESYRDDELLEAHQRTQKTYKTLDVQNSTQQIEGRMIDFSNKKLEITGAFNSQQISDPKRKENVLRKSKKDGKQRSSNPKIYDVNKDIENDYKDGDKSFEN